MNILGIETSCDDTCAAVVQDGRRVLSNCTATSAAEQNLYGGVVPEIASRRHIEHISQVAQQALAQAGLSAQQLDAVAVTFAPGLIGAVLVGVNFAKSLAFAAGKPLVPVHHLRGHIAALYLTYPQLEPPFLCLVASGGHSHIVQVEGYTRFRVLGRTVDDAAGEAFDKVARTLGLGYPGGPAVAKPRRAEAKKAYPLPTPHVEGAYNVSFSGLKTAVLNAVNRARQAGERWTCPAWPPAFSGASQRYWPKSCWPQRATQVPRASASRAAWAQTRLCAGRCSRVPPRWGPGYFCPSSLCGDNAAMVAAQGYYEFLAGHTAQSNLNGLPTLGIDDESLDGPR